MLVRIEAERVLEVFEGELEMALLRLDDLSGSVSEAFMSGCVVSEADLGVLKDLEAHVERGRDQIRSARADAALLLAHA